MKKALVFISILLFSANIFSQSWPSSSATRPTFSGFGVTTEDESSSIFGNESSTESFAGDYVTTPQTKGFGGDPNPGNPNPNPDPEDVPIVESILGLLGLGSAYAWRLFSKNRRKED